MFPLLPSLMMATSSRLKANHSNHQFQLFPPCALPTTQINTCLQHNHALLQDRYLLTTIHAYNSVAAGAGIPQPTIHALLIRQALLTGYCLFIHKIRTTRS